MSELPKLSISPDNMERKYPLDTVIAVLCGGISSERKISLKSGKNVLKALKRLGYKNSFLIDLDSKIVEKLKRNKVQVVYNALHGKYGEDGCIQGLLELLGIEYTGCGVLSSSICMNKEITKNTLKNFPDIPLIKSVLVKNGTDEKDISEKIKGLKFPVMLKPVCQGSSIGMYRVGSKKEFLPLYRKAKETGQDIMVENFLKGKSLTVGVLEKGNKILATEILELCPKSDWYDYRAKYTKGMTKFILPAELSEKMTEKIKKMAIKVYKICGCKGATRVDFLLSNEIPYFLEINTSPGMIELSDLPAQAKASEISYDELVFLILNGAGLNK